MCMHTYTHKNVHIHIVPNSTRARALSLSHTHTHTQILSVERFGMSAPGDIVFKELGMTADHLIKACKDYM